MTDPTSLPAFGLAAGGAPTVPRQGMPLQARVMEALRAQGFDPAVDTDDGGLAVTVAEHVVLVRFFETLPPMVRVMGQWLIHEGVEGDELVRLRAANAVTGALNLVKVTVHDDRLTVAVDLVIGDGLDLGSLLASAVDAVLGSANTWHATVTRLTSGGPE